MVAKEMLECSIHCAIAMFKQEVSNRVFKSSKILILVEAPCSRPQIVHGLIDIFDKNQLPDEFAYWIPLGEKVQGYGEGSF